MDPVAEHLAPLLSQLVNYERTRPDRRLWDLATMRQLLQRPAAPRAPRPAVQVGGSKGKGTTSGFLAGLVQAAGGRAGLYTSPHVTTLAERIRVAGQDVPTPVLERILRSLLEVPGLERPPTFFEAMTLAAAAWFAECHVDLAVYEVGLGGRHDATTALPIDAAIVTMFELEHTDVLGDTIEQIAAEKAPIVRPGGLGFTAATGAGLAVLAAHARAVDARLLVLGQHFGWRRLRVEPAGFAGELWLPDGRHVPAAVPGGAAFEAPALALAAACFATLCPALPLRLDPATRPGLPCRFEVRDEADGEVLVLDGAHTEQSLAQVVAECQRRWPGRRAVVLFASATGKRWRQGLSAVLPIADGFVVTGLLDTTSEEPATIAAWLSAQGASNEVVADVPAGLAALRRHPGPRLVVGSFYLAGAVRRLLDGR